MKIRQFRKLNSGVMALVIACLLVATLWSPTVQNLTQRYEPSNIAGQFAKGIVIGFVGTAEAATADFICDGVADDVQWQEALDALPAGGGKLIGLSGNYNFTATVSRAINNVTIEGMGKSTYFAYNASSAIFSAGSQSNWVFRDFSTDNGGVGVGSATAYRIENVYKDATQADTRFGKDRLEIATGKLLKGAGTGADPIEILGTKRFFLRVDAAGTDLEWARGVPFGAAAEAGLDFSHWTSTLTGTGSEVSKGYGLLSIETGTTAGSTARSRGYGFGWLAWSDFRLIWKVGVYYNEPSANSQRWLKVDTDVSGNPTGASIGFRIDGTAIKGIVHDGTSLTVVDLATTYSDANSRFEIQFDGTTIYWYVAGDLKGQSTAVPSAVRAENHYLVVNVINGADATENLFRIASHFWIREI